MRKSTMQRRRVTAMKFGELESGPAWEHDDLTVDDVISATGWASAQAIGEPESEVAGADESLVGVRFQPNP